MLVLTPFQYSFAILCRALKYPQCLHFLEAVQSSAFREAIACTANAKFIEEQQLLQWQYYTRKRQRLHVSFIYYFKMLLPEGN